jgi:hypothetical protein
LIKTLKKVSQEIRRLDLDKIKISGDSTEREWKKKTEKKRRVRKKRVEKIKKHNFYVNMVKLRMLIFLTCL